MVTIGFHAKVSNVNESCEVVTKYIPDAIPMLQVFLRNPQNGRATNIYTNGPPPCAYIAHSAYIHSPWKTPRNKKWRSNARINAMSLVDAPDCEGIVIHLTRASMDPEIFHAGIQAMKDAFVSQKTTTQQIILENPATTGTDYMTPAGMIREYEAACGIFAPHKSDAHKRIAICIDTAHLFSAGESLKTAHAARKFFTTLCKSVPYENLYIHLNDSHGNFGTGKDIHAPLCKGYIWKDDDSGLRWIVKFADKHEIPMILERAGTENIINDLKIVREILD